MISDKLLDPQSIVVIGGSNAIEKTGGRALRNLIEHGFKGDIYVVNPKETEVQGIQSYSNVSDLPNVDVAIIAIAAKFCVETVRILAAEKNTKGFIIFSAGFSEESHEGALAEKEIAKIVNSVGGSLIGPNCIGMMNANYIGAFARPVPVFSKDGCDFISGSGATAVFIMESGIQKGLRFNSIFSVGNSAQLGVEDILQYMDETFNSEKDSKVKILYIESINKPEMMLKHAASLIRKGCKIAAIKAGSSEAGSRAASSHTGALASSDVAVDALFKKAGIVRCYGREELTTVASIFMHKELKGKNIAIATHAGGPAVMLTDALSEYGFQIPKIEGTKAEQLLSKLFPGSSVSNPIDFLATGTSEQLGCIIDACDKDFNNIDGIAVIFGSPGLFSVYDVYDLLDEKMKSCSKPIFPILPSIINVADEIKQFLSKGRINFPDEVVFGKALGKVYNTAKPAPKNPEVPAIDTACIRQIINQATDGYIAPEKIRALLDAAGINRAGEAVVTTREDAIRQAHLLSFPIVMKVVGPVHKSDVGGVVLNVNSEEVVLSEFDRMIKIPATTAILIQPMLSGTELFVGAKREPKFGAMVLAGLGGIFIEVLKDVNAGLAPLCKEEAINMITSLRGYKILKGVRGQEHVDIDKFAEIIMRVSALVNAAPEIAELDLNPLLGKSNQVIAVDARIRIEK